MLYLILILFFASLFGIMFMIGRKMLLIQKGYEFPEEAVVPIGQYFEEWKDKAMKKIKLVEFVALVIIIRLYVKLTNVIKILYEELSGRVKDTYAKRTGNTGETSIIETSGFLKKVGEYKRKVRKIKQKVAKEEKNS